MNRTNDGNTWLLNNAINLGIRKASNVLNLNAGWIYANTNRQLTNNDLSSSLDFDIYDKDPRLYYWGLGAFDKIYSLKIINRFQGGLGAAYNIVNTASLRLNVSDGILYEYSDLYTNDSLRDTYNTFRNSLRISYHVSIKGIVSLDGQHFFQPSLKQGNDYLIKSSSSLTVRVWRGVNFTASLLYNKVNRTHQENLLLTYGITVEKNFRLKR